MDCAGWCPWSDPIWLNGGHRWLWVPSVISIHIAVSVLLNDCKRVGRRLVWAGGVRFSGKWNSIWMSERTRKVDDGQGYFLSGGGGIAPFEF